MSAYATARVSVEEPERLVVNGGTAGFTRRRSLDVSSVVRRPVPPTPADSADADDDALLIPPFLRNRES